MTYLLLFLFSEFNGVVFSLPFESVMILVTGSVEGLLHALVCYVLGLGMSGRLFSWLRRFSK
jgi:hypothetical protein